MNGIDVAFVGLLVIAIVKNLRHVQMIGRRLEKIVIRQQRRLSGSHVGEDRPCRFFARIGAMANLIAMFAAAGFARLLKTTAVNVVEPTMIKTTQPAVLDPPITEVRATM